MQAAQDILVEDRGRGAVRITINRPHKHNALSRSVLADLASEVTRSGADPQTRFIVIQGSGDRYFAAGGDLVDLSSVRTPEATLEMSNEARDALDAIRDCPVPVVAYVNGDAIGGGAELAVACDMRLIAAPARIGFIQGKLAITSAWGGGTDLCALIGASRALRMMTRCELIGADLAVAWGLADAVIGDGPDGSDIDAFLKPLHDRSALVIRAMKAQATASRKGLSYPERRAIEQQGLVATWVHADHWAAAERVLTKEKR